MEFVKRLHVLLSILNGGYDIDHKKYEAYALETAAMFTKLYPWFYMPLGVHRMLMHGDQVCVFLSIKWAKLSKITLNVTLLTNNSEL